MPPKKDDKKGKGGKVEKKEINVSDFQRPAVAIAEAVVEGAGDAPLMAPLTGKLANIEILFPEWEVACEVWTESLTPEAVPEIKYPAHIAVAEYKPLRSFLGLDSEEAAAAADPKKAAVAKKDAKKGAPAGGGEMEEPPANEVGRPLPRMVLQAGGEEVSAAVAESSFAHTTIFRRYWSSEQKERRAEWMAMREAGAEAIKLAADSPDDAAAAAAALQVQQRLEAFERTNTPEFLNSPAGPEIDPYMCDAYRLIARFAPSVLSAAENQVDDKSASGSMQFLWRSIYPKLASGRPCYNPASKYCVRLFLGGKWRKILVTDTVPLDAEGLPAIAASVNPLELWPMILSKAVYTVYTACGYNRSLEHVSTGNSDGIQVNHFLSFAIHVLTGWQPSTPWNVGRSIADTARILGLLEGMTFSGTLPISASSTPGPVPTATIVSAENNAAAAGGKEVRADTEGHGDGYFDVKFKSPELRTKKFYKDEYRRRAQERDALAQKIAERERKIASIQERLTIPFGECFMACCKNPDAPGEFLALPILGLDFGEEGTLPGAVKLLVDWETSPPPPLPIMTQLSPEDAAKDSILDRMKREAPSLPLSTILQMRWITVQYLVDNGAFCFSFDTMVRSPKKAVLGWHWCAPSGSLADSKAAKDVKGRGKDAKVGGASETSSDPCVDPGSLPPVLLKLSSAAFFVPAESALSATAMIISAKDAEAQAAIDAQAGQLEHFSFSPTVMKPLSTHLSLSVMIHADLPTETLNIPSDVVVVLQEVRSHGEEPLVLRVELSARTGIPMTRSTYHIPADRINPVEPMLFWVRMFTQASVYLSFGCSVEIAVGEAQSIWQDMGRSVLVREGEASVTCPATEQMLHKIPLQLQAEEVSDENSSGDADDVALFFLHVANRNIAKCVSAMVLGDRRASQTEQAYFMPRLEGVMIPISSSVPRQVVARVYPPDDGLTPIPAFPWKAIVLSRKPLIEPIAEVQVGAVVSRYSGKYHPNHDLVLFRDILAIDKNSFPAAVRIAMDSLVVGPAAVMSSNTSPEEVPEPLTAAAVALVGLDLKEGICIVLRTYRKSNRKLIGEYRGRGIMQVYNIAIDGFLEDGEEPPAPIPAGAAPDPKAKGAPPKKDDKKGANGGAPAAVEGVEIIFECKVDETAMQVPAEWRCRLPYTFDSVLASEAVQADVNVPVIDASSLAVLPLHTVAPVAPKFGWQMDMLAGIVTSSRHDVTDLEEFANIKNAWEDAQEGRATKAAAALAHYHERKRIKMQLQQDQQPSREEKSESVVNETVVGLLATALEKEVDEVRITEAILLESIKVGNQSLIASFHYIHLLSCPFLPACLTQYQEFVVTAGQSAVLLTEEDIEAGRVKCAEQQVASEDFAKNGVEKFTGFNERVRKMTSARVGDLLKEANANHLQIGEKWKAREEYRAWANSQNDNLRWILDKTSGAIDKTLAEEDPAAVAAATKAKGGAKKK